MKRFLTRILAAALLLCLLCTVVACSSKKGDTETAPPEESTTAARTESPTAPPAEEQTPDFSVMDQNGKAVKLSDFYGQPIVLNFWASWCPPCKAELPDFEAAYKKYEGKVTFLMVNLTDNQKETVEVAQNFVRSQGYTFPVYFDVNYQAASAYGIRSIPQTYFIDAQGNPVACATGMITATQLEEGIGMIYSE